MRELVATRYVGQRSAHSGRDEVGEPGIAGRHHGHNVIACGENRRSYGDISIVAVKGRCSTGGHRTGHHERLVRHSPDPDLMRYGQAIDTLIEEAEVGDADRSRRTELEADIVVDTTKTRSRPSSEADRRLGERWQSKDGAPEKGHGESETKGSHEVNVLCRTIDRPNPLMTSSLSA